MKVRTAGSYNGSVAVAERSGYGALPIAGKRGMPMGYDTRLHDGGASISGGQRQRLALALARALAHRPPVLLLDEATSELDTVTEQQVYENLAQVAATTIVIAHRLSTVRNADLIVVMDRGAVAKTGTHEELVAMHGMYWQLLNAQSRLGAAQALPTSGP